MEVNAGAECAEGDLSFPEISNLKLLSEPRDVAKAVAALGKNDELIVRGKERDGYPNVQGSNASGWVKKLCISRRSGLADERNAATIVQRLRRP